MQEVKQYSTVFNTNQMIYLRLDRKNEVITVKLKDSEDLLYVTKEDDDLYESYLKGFLKLEESVRQENK